MLSTLAIIHYLSFAVAIGGGIATMMAGIQMKSAEPQAAAALGRLQRNVGRAGFVGLLFLWATGLALTYIAHDGFGAMGWAFWLKMAVVVGLSALAVRAQMLSLAAQRAGTRPDPAIMRKLGAGTGGLAVLAVILAVVAFH